MSFYIAVPLCDESVVDVLRGLCGAGIVIAFIDPTDGSRSDDLMVSDNKWRPMIDAVLYTRTSRSMRSFTCGSRRLNT